MPNLAALDNYYNIHAILDKIGMNAKAVAEQYGASYATSDLSRILNDKDVDLLYIGTRHNMHAPMAVEAAEAGKAVILEKPMAMNDEELEELVKVLEETRIPFMVGFNRRFSPFASKIKEIVAGRTNPMIINYQMNAGFIPLTHWVHTEEGGGRNIGEGCHIYDLFNFFTEAEVESVSATGLSPQTKQMGRNDNFVATIKYSDGSVCNLIYTALGNPDVSKERMDIYVDGKVIQMDDYRKLVISGIPSQKIETQKEDKGHKAELAKFARSMKQGNGYPIPLGQLCQAATISFEVERLL
jgi:predicted dehydrogenase